MANALSLSERSAAPRADFKCSAPEPAPSLLPLRLRLVPQAKYRCMQTGYEPKLLMALETKLLQENTHSSAPRQAVPGNLR